MTIKISNSKTIRLGLMTPYTGVASLYGDEIANAGSIACEIINDKGGVLGKKLELIILDDGSMPETAIITANKLIDAYQCDAIIGNLLSNSRIDVAYKVSLPRKVIQLNFSFYEGSIITDYFFNFAALPNQQIQPLVNYLIEKHGMKFFFAGSNYEWPKGSIDVAKKILKEHGGEVVGEEYFNFGEEDPDGLLDRLMKSGANVFLPYFVGNDQITLLKKFVDLGLKNQIAVGMGHFDELMLSKMEEKYREGFYSSNSFFMSINNSQTKEYFEHLKKIKGINGIWPNGNGVITNFGEATFACVTAYGAAINDAKSLQKDKIIESLKKVNIKSLQGDIKMNPVTNHSYVNNYLVKSCKDGTFNIIRTKKLIKPHIPSRYQDYLIYLKEKENEKEKYFQKNTFFPKSIFHMNTIEEFLEIFDNINLCSMIIDINYNIIIMNKKSHLVLNYKNNDLINHSIFLVFPPRLREKYKNTFNNFLLEEKTVSEDKIFKNNLIGYSSTGLEIKLKGFLLKKNIDGNKLLIFCFNDLSYEIKKLEEDSWNLTHDPLTKLMNVHLLKERITNAITRCKNKQKNIMLAIIKISDFKLLANIHGFKLKDQFILEITNRIISLLPPGEILGKSDDKTFILFCEELPNENSAILLLNKILSEINKIFNIESGQFFIHTNIGAYFTKNYSTTPEKLFNGAELAVIKGQSKGHNNITFYDKSLSIEYGENLNLSNNLNLALVNNELCYELQPIYSKYDYNIIGAELLIRWNHEGSIISPGIFMPIAEKSGSIFKIGYWIFEQGLMVQKKLKNKLDLKDIPYISINISNRQLEDIDFINNITKLVKKVNADPKGIVIEITESSIMRNIDESKKIIEALKVMNFKIAIDDFGTGYSSIKELSKLSIDIIKIDKTFIDNIQHEPKDLKLLESLMNFCNSLENVKIIIEGIEQIEQVKLLANLNFTGYQGYYFSRPLSLENFMDSI